LEYFTDRDLGAEIFPGILRQAGITIHQHRDHFPENAPDTVWLPEVAARGWIILSRDRNIRRNPLERDAVMESSAAFFALSGGHAPTAQLARNFVNTLARVESFIRRHPRPFIARISRPSPVEEIDRGGPGRVEMVLTLAQWEEMKRRGL
jgi:hypothetical protein